MPDVALRVPEVAKWQQKYRVDWDATDGRNGGAQQTVWEILLEMERLNGKAKEEDLGALALVLDLAKAFERVSFSCGLGLGNVLQLPQEDLAGTSEHERAADPLTTITAILPGSKWSYLLLRIVLQGALHEVTKIYPLLKLKVFVDDITALLRGRTSYWMKWQRKVMKKLREEVCRKGLKFVSDQRSGRKERSNMIAPCGCLENELRQFSREGVTKADSVDTWGVDLRKRANKLEAKEKTRRKKCRVRFSLIKKNKTFQKSYMKVGVKKVLPGEVETEETDGEQQQAKESTTSLSSSHGSIWPLKKREELSTLASQYWAEGVWSGKWHP